MLCSLYMTHLRAVMLRSRRDRSSPLHDRHTQGVTWARDFTLPHLWCNRLKKKYHHAEALL